ncbi:MAG: cobalamin biosynthesis protein CbiX [Opitutales bacterium]|nr:cobalamin biosynthesis protein CbiX [Opitutales bacterium]
MRTLLVDNGSLRPDAVLNLRAVAARLSERVGERVDPVSLLHSSKIDSALLGGEPAQTWERYTKACLAEGERAFTLLPFFFGPTGAIQSYMPERLASLRKRFGNFSLARAPFLFDEAVSTDALARMVAENVRRTLREKGLTRAPVVLVDHGSPLPAVTYVRNFVAGQLSLLLSDCMERIAAASMERREGDLFAFNDPLLGHQLSQPGYNRGDVIIAMLFLSPGRHAGPDGDVAEICAAAEARHPGLRCHMTDLVGTQPGIIDLLATRWTTAQTDPVYL